VDSTAGRIRWLHVFGWTVLLAVLATLALLRWSRGHAPAPLPPEPDDAWRVANEEVAAQFQAHFEPLGASASLAQHCGVGGSGDAARLVALDAWRERSFFLALDARGDYAQAAWRTLRVDAKHSLKAGRARLVNVAPAAWQPLRAALAAPAFARLPPRDVRLPEVDGATILVETCLAGRYHFVQRYVHGDDGDREFHRVVEAMRVAAGAVYEMP
jgi:hypothetical protein